MRLKSISAVSALVILSAADGSSVPGLQRMVPPALQTLVLCVERGDEDGLSAGICLLLDLIEAPLPILTQSLPQVVEFSMNAALNREVSCSMRAYCLQVCTTPVLILSRLSEEVIFCFFESIDMSVLGYSSWLIIDRNAPLVSTSTTRCLLQDHSHIVIPMGRRHRAGHI